MKWLGVVLCQMALFILTRSLRRTATSAPSVCVIGGGAAGFFSAIECARMLKENEVSGASVTIFEASNECLSKVLISGGGRCNVMHDASKDMATILRAYPRGEKQLRSPFFSKFGPREAAQWFKNRGVKLITEADGRVFPITDDSRTIADTLWEEARKYGVIVRKQCKVEQIDVLDWGGLRVNDENFDRLIIATGSSRQGHGLVRKLGHNVIDPVPSLFSFVVKEKALRELAGASVQDAHVTLVLGKDFHKSNAGKVFRPQFLKGLNSQGPVLFTHQGLSGPAIIRLSGYSARVLAATKYAATLQVNWIQAERNDVYNLLLTTKAGNHRKKRIGNLSMVSSDVLSKRVWHFLVERAGIALEKLWGDLSKSEANRLADELCCGKFSVVGRGLFRDEFVTAGGVSLDEVNFSSYRSRLTENRCIYFAGECMDVDAITGGFNFQHAWTSGWIAGHSVALDIAHECELNPPLTQ